MFYFKIAFILGRQRFFFFFFTSHCTLCSLCNPHKEPCIQSITNIKGYEGLINGIFCLLYHFSEIKQNDDMNY